VLLGNGGGGKNTQILNYRVQNSLAEYFRRCGTVYIYIYIYIYICTLVCVCVCVYVCIYIYSESCFSRIAEREALGRVFVLIMEDMGKKSCVLWSLIIFILRMNSIRAIKCGE